MKQSGDGESLTMPKTVASPTSAYQVKPRNAINDDLTDELTANYEQLSFDFQPYLNSNHRNNPGNLLRMQLTLWSLTAPIAMKGTKQAYPGSRSRTGPVPGLTPLV